MRRWMFIRYGGMAKGFPWARRLLMSIMVAFGGLVLLTSAARAVDYHVGGNVDEGLVAYFKFDEGAGTVTRSFPNTTVVIATLQTGASFSMSLPPGFTQLNFATLDLDGAAGFATVPDSPALNSVNEFTISAWAKRSAINTSDVIYDSGEQDRQWYVGFLGDLSGAERDNKLAFTIEAIRDFTSTTAIVDTNWHHVAVVKSGSAPNNQVQLYIDGILDATRACRTRWRSR